MTESLRDRAVQKFQAALEHQAVTESAELPAKLPVKLPAELPAKLPAKLPAELPVKLLAKPSEARALGSRSPQKPEPPEAGAL